MAKEIARLEGVGDDSDWLEIDGREDSFRHRFLMWDKLSDSVALVIVESHNNSIRANIIDPADCKEALIHPDCYIDRAMFIGKTILENIEE